MVSRKSEDKNRRFVIQYFLEDNTMSIREPPIRNSGVVGGSFLGRCPCKHPEGSKILPINFYVGAVVEVRCGGDVGGHINALGGVSAPNATETHQCTHR